jgi:hypothetical protein
MKKVWKKYLIFCIPRPFFPINPVQGFEDFPALVRVLNTAEFSCPYYYRAEAISNTKEAGSPV